MSGTSTSTRTVCVVGAGGREHALARVLGRTADVVVTPGNPGITGTTPDGHTLTSTLAPPWEVDADLFVIGPEIPLVDGLADRLRSLGRHVVGPGADGARLEGSKAFMKEVLAEAKVPTARFGAFDRVDDAIAFLHTMDGPWVVKTDGLAAGKGVLVAGTLAEAEADVRAKLSGDAFGQAGKRVVIEEGLTGPECSLLVLCDGTNIVALEPAQDFKRIGDGDTGPNTGGMGAYSPLGLVDADLVDRLLDEAVEPLVAVMRGRGIDYRGVLYAGIMLTPDGPKVLEYNVRFGDPETQVVLPRLDCDLVDVLTEVAEGRLTTTPTSTDAAAVCVVAASEGYPEAPRTGDPIQGIAEAELVPKTFVFHAGTCLDDDGRVVTAGGRVLAVTSLGPTLGVARIRAYEGVDRLSWPGMHVRRDIAEAAVAAGQADPAGQTEAGRRAASTPQTAAGGRAAASPQDLSSKEATP